MRMKIYRCCPRRTCDKCSAYLGTWKPAIARAKGNTLSSKKRSWSGTSSRTRPCCFSRAWLLIRSTSCKNQRQGLSSVRCLSQVLHSVGVAYRPCVNCLPPSSLALEDHAKSVGSCSINSTAAQSPDSDTLSQHLEGSDITTTCHQ